MHAHGMKKQIRLLQATVCAAVCILIMIAPSACKKDDDANPQTTAPKNAFVDVASQAGINMRHHKPILDHKLDNIMSWVCSVK